MGYTKREIIDQAFEEIGLASYTFDLQPEQLESALRRLDGMMAVWNGKGIRLGYPLPSSPSESDLADDVNVPDRAIEAMVTNLAIRLAPSLGKSLSPDTKLVARQSYAQLVSKSSSPIEMQIDASSVPAGAGGKRGSDGRSPFLPEPTDRLQAGSDSLLTLE